MLKFIEKTFTFFYPILRKWGMGYSFASYLSLFLNIALLCFVAYSIYVVFRLLLVTIMIFINMLFSFKTILVMWCSGRRDGGIRT